MGFFTDRSKAVLLLWILFVIYVPLLSLLYCLVCSCILVITCWEKADLLALLCLMFPRVFVTFPYGVSGKDVVLDCIDSWSLPSLLLATSCFQNSFVMMCGAPLTLKAPKNASEKWRLLKSSAANNCLTLLTNLRTEANRVDPDQTAPSLIWVHTVCHRGFLNI